MPKDHSTTLQVLKHRIHNVLERLNLKNTGDIDPKLASTLDEIEL